ncbi:hypothetical protein HK102_013425 [Quaeritorhiza haematococci]|nr:hypothetical protein HK102_013425 [Quaeritorhiza haematococci]
MRGSTLLSVAVLAAVSAIPNVASAPTPQNPPTPRQCSPDLAATATCEDLTLTPENIQVQSCSGTPPETALKLVRSAIAGLGFRQIEGPREGDRFFVGRYYVAWVDSTGYYTKLNGLWNLNGKVCEDSDFTLQEPDLNSMRPINMFLPGEDGDGAWPASYQGAEHYEIPTFKGDTHDSQSGLMEANHFTNFNLPHWTQCVNADNSEARWINQPGRSEFTVSGNTLTASNTGKLEIVARFHGNSFPCRGNFVFGNGQSGDFMLVTTYTFYGNEPKVDRQYQYINLTPFPYTPHNSIQKLIGGMLLTKWPHPHYLKQFQRAGAFDSVVLADYAPFPYNGAGQTADMIDVRGGGAMTLSATGTMTSGRSVTISQAGGLGDVGICLCHVHGGFELGGSVLQDQRVEAGQPSPLHSRSFIFGTELDKVSATQIETLKILGNDPDPSIHDLGSLVDDKSWGQGVGRDPGYLLARRSMSVKRGSVGQAAFYLAIDIVNGAAEDKVVTLDIALNGREAIATKEIRRKDFFADNTIQRFVLPFQVTSADGNLEPRIFWHNKAFIKTEGVVVNTLPPVIRTDFSVDAVSPDVSHQVGSDQNTGFWGASVDTADSGYLFFGPRVPVPKTTNVDLTMSMFVDVVDADNNKVATVDVLAHFPDGSNRVVFEQVIHRRDFAAPDQVRNFDFHFSVNQGAQLEPRVFYHDNSYLRLGRVSLRAYDA